jgi:hypothetical protein
MSSGHNSMLAHPLSLRIPRTRWSFDREPSRRVALPFAQRRNRKGGAQATVMNGLSCRTAPTIIRRLAAVARGAPQVRECLDRILRRTITPNRGSGRSFPARTGRSARWRSEGCRHASVSARARRG